jgi:hypothetical protein
MRRNRDHEFGRQAGNANLEVIALEFRDRTFDAGT